MKSPTPQIIQAMKELGINEIGCGYLCRDLTIPTRPFYKCGRCEDFFGILLCPSCTKIWQERINRLKNELVFLARKLDWTLIESNQVLKIINRVENIKLIIGWWEE